MKYENNEMQISNESQYARSDDQAWDLLAEFSWSEFLSSQDQGGALTAGLLFQAVRELGISRECVENIKVTMAECAKEALAQFKQGRLEPPGRMRIFCQKKNIDDSNLTRADFWRYHAEQAMEHSQMILDTSPKLIGGWGYFLIERGGIIPPDSCEHSWNSVDLYLYKEGV